MRFVHALYPAGISTPVSARRITESFKKWRALVASGEFKRIEINTRDCIRVNRRSAKLPKDGEDPCQDGRTKVIGLPSIDGDRCSVAFERRGRPVTYVLRECVI